MGCGYVSGFWLSLALASLCSLPVALLFASAEVAARWAWGHIWAWLSARIDPPGVCSRWVSVSCCAACRAAAPSRPCPLLSQFRS